MALRKFRGALLAAALLALATCARADINPVVPGEVLVGLNPGVAAPAVMFLGRTMGYEPGIAAHRVRLAPGQTMAQALAALRVTPGVRFAEPNHVLRVTAAPTDPYYSSQWAPATTQANLAWQIWNPRQTVVVAVIDTGIDASHPDLANRILRDSSGNMVAYDVLSNKTGSARDGFGHGTHVAGIIAAEVNNAIGVAGVAGFSRPGGVVGVKLMPVRVMDDNGAGTDASVASGITWAADHGAQVISLSLGGPDHSSTMESAARYAWGKGCVVVAAAGNLGTSAPYYPGASPNVISVAATDSNDQLAGFSNFGSWVTLAAPGVGVLSTTPTYAPSQGLPLNYAAMSGTSMAAPHVAAEAAMVMAQRPDMTNAQVVAIMTRSLDPCVTPPTRAIAPGSGRINIYRALLAVGNCLTPPTPPGAPLKLLGQAGDGVVCLAWLKVAGAASYRVYRSSTAQPAPAPIATGLTQSVYTDLAATNGVIFTYYVTAVNADGESAPSPPVTESPVRPAPPGPTSLNANTVRATVYLYWRLPAAGTARTVRIYRASAPNGPWALLAALPRTTLYIDRDLKRPIRVYYLVTAVLTNGQETAPSNMAQTYVP